ncbi:MAG: glycosyltransferase involved in cell wall biosynthesis [Flavobacteriales bacterium]|jgi:glycosyltransferase involved in cell wall biosynthesis
MITTRRILFLYTELAEYVLACIEQLEKEDVEVHVVRFPVNSEAPFEFRQLAKTKIYDRSKFDKDQLQKLAEDINPHIILCSGWIDKGYLNICRQAKSKTPTVLLLDNQWEGGIKQRIATIASPFFLKSKFTKAWVPGAPQKEFAQHLGFKDISTGFYCADTHLFETAGASRNRSIAEHYPKKLLFVGRYLEFKGIFDLWKAFIELHDEGVDDWELICAGTGDLWDERIEHPAIRHMGFIQPAELLELVKETGAFVLPSHREPWGVVVHEMAAAGLPMVCSSTIGAATMFLEEGANGFFHQAGDQADLKVALKRMMSSSKEDLILMGESSLEKSKSISPQIWTKTLLELL